MPWLAGVVSLLSNIPTVHWVLLGSGESNEGQEVGSLYCGLSAGRTLPLLAGKTSIQNLKACNYNYN
jgi:hypothetical protein